MYPIMLQLKDRSCVVIGGGKVAARKVSQLVASDARVTVISPELIPSLQAMADTHQLTWVARPYTTGILSRYKPFLVFAATDSAQVNEQVASDVRALGALVNVVDGNIASDFNNMAMIEKSLITVGISTGGSSPAMLKLLKVAIDEAISDEFITLTDWLGELRHVIRERMDTQAERQHIYEQILASEVLELLRDGEIEAARTLFDDIVEVRVEA